MIVGIDEVGRGCLAGPVVASAVILDQPISGLADSKLISKKQRTYLDSQIRKSAIFGIGWVWPGYIDKYGLTKAVARAMQLALGQLKAEFSEVIIDGNYNYLPNVAGVRTQVKADQLVPEVSAASIIAKVARDNYMIAQAKNYPFYSFDKHMGYGTAAHLKALNQYGICKLHRKIYKPVKVLVS